jgi:hypothetical protein
MYMHSIDKHGGKITRHTRKGFQMATVEQIGKRWYIRLKDGSFLKNKDNNNARYFNSQYMAEFIAADINEQEVKKERDL